MKNSFKIAAGVSLILFVCLVTARADYIDLPIKWSQPITDVNLDGIIDGSLVSSDHTVVGVKADDFTSDGRPIVAVRWWGGYISDNNQRPNGYTGPFDISFHLSAGAHPNSLPVDPYLVLYENITAQEVFVGMNQFGMYVYRYDAYLPTPFYETAGVEYFIDIDKPTSETWGWQVIDTSLSPIQDWAANTGGNHVGPWSHIPDDLAFELMTIPEPSTIALLALGGLALLWRKRS